MKSVSDSNERWHGTSSGYQYHMCRCEKCVSFHREKAAASARARTRNPPLIAADDTRHGTPNGYNNLKCRCDRCRAAWAEKCRTEKADRVSRIPDSKHGTEGGYGNWGCRCRECTDAWVIAVTARARRAAVGDTGPSGRPRGNG